MAPNPKIKRVAVLGGTGFLGTEIVARFLAEGVNVRIGVRHPDQVRVTEAQQQIAKAETFYTDVRDQDSIARTLQGCDAAVNAVGLYVERGSETFHAVHEVGATNVAHHCAEQKVKRLIHLSGIGADPNSTSSYVRARAEGEHLVNDAFPKTTILRPSVLFGPSDKFINTLARIVRHAPVIPLFGRGLTKLQPVYVGDVGLAALRALQMSASEGKTYELGGPHALTYRKLIELVMERAGKRRPLLPLPFFMWEAMAALVSPLPAPPVTRDQIALMRDDNVVAENALSLSDLGVIATALEDVLPDYAF